MHQTVQQETEQGCQRLAFHRLKPNVYKANRSSQTTMLRAQAELAQISEMVQHASLAGPPPLSLAGGWPNGSSRIGTSREV